MWSVTTVACGHSFGPLTAWPAAECLKHHELLAAMDTYLYRLCHVNVAGFDAYFSGNQDYIQIPSSSV